VTSVVLFVAWLGFAVLSASVLYALRVLIRTLRISCGYQRRFLLEISAIALLSVLAFVLVPLKVPGNLLISDSAEYALSARELVLHGEYQLKIGEHSFPPRYAPWYSLWLLSPFVALAPDNFGIGYVPQLALFCSGVLAAVYWSLFFAGRCAALLCLLLVLTLPGLRYFSQQILTDLPTASLMLLLGALLAARWREGSGFKDSLFKLYLCAGILAAFISAFRINFFWVFLLPLGSLACERSLVALPGKILCYSAALLPSAVVAGLSAYYQALVFGSPLRSGYHYWVPVPYEFFSLTFSLSRYLERNLQVGVSPSGVPLLLILVAGIPVAQRWYRKVYQRELLPESVTRPFGLMAGLVLMATAVVYLPYFYASPRFYFPLTMLLSVGIAGVGGAVFEAKGYTGGKAQIFFLLGIALIGLVRFNQNYSSTRSSMLERICSETSTDARILLTSIDPLFASAADARCVGARRYIPFSRELEYASKRIAPSALQVDTPPECITESCSWKYLESLGLEPALALVYLENPAAAVSSHEFYVETAAGKDLPLELAQAACREIAGVDSSVDAGRLFHCAAGSNASSP
jgi:hypothetical protein